MDYQLMDDLLTMLTNYRAEVPAMKRVIALSVCAGQIIAQVAPNEEERQHLRQEAIAAIDAGIKGQLGA